MEGKEEGRRRGEKKVEEKRGEEGKREEREEGRGEEGREREKMEGGIGRGKERLRVGKRGEEERHPQPISSVPMRKPLLYPPASLLTTRSGICKHSFKPRELSYAVV